MVDYTGFLIFFIYDILSINLYIICNNQKKQLNSKSSAMFDMSWCSGGYFTKLNGYEIVA